MNIRSCNKQLNELLAHLNSIKPKFHLIVLSETWLNFKEDWLDIEGYKAFHSIRRSKRGGGITVLSNINFSSELIPHLTRIKETFKSVCIEIIFLKKNYKIIGAYRPPSSSLLAFNDLFFSLLTDNDKKRIPYDCWRS